MIFSSLSNTAERNEWPQLTGRIMNSKQININPHKRFRTWCHTFPSVLWRPAADHWEPRTLPASVCWRLTELRFLSSISIPGAAITHLNAHWSCHWVDAFKSPTTKCGEDWDPLVSTSCRLHQLPQAPLRVGTDFVTPSAAVRDLGILLVSDTSMSFHVRKTVSLRIWNNLPQHAITSPSLRVFKNRLKTISSSFP